MAREPKGAVVSLRMSEEEQAQLRQMADERGSSVSDLIRTFVSREMDAGTAATVTVTTSQTGRPTQLNEGIFWNAHEGAVIAGGTLTVFPPSQA